MYEHPQRCFPVFPFSVFLFCVRQVLCGSKHFILVLLTHLVLSSQIRSLLAKWDLASSLGLQKASLNVVPQLVIRAPCKDATNIHKIQDIHNPDDDKRPILQKVSGGTVSVVASFKSELRVLLGSRHCGGTVRQGNMFAVNAREHGGMQGSFTGTRVK
jgi:hypothetical protein